VATRKTGSAVVAGTVLALAVTGACNRTDEHAEAASESAGGHRAGLETADASRSAKRHYRLGERAQAPDYAMTVRAVEECKVAAHYRPQKGHIKLGVEVTIQGTGTREVPVNPFYAELIDSSGSPRHTSFGGCTPELPALRVRKGDEARGWITFEVPARAHGLRLQYSPFVVGTGRQILSFDLGR
jgi:hypothetical protein